MNDFTFAYGSNMNLEELKKWMVGKNFNPSKIIFAQAAILADYDLIWNYYSSTRECGAANLTSSRGSYVWGVLIELKEDLLGAFDKKEGHPQSYSRGNEHIPVTTRDGRAIPAWVYIAKPKTDGTRDTRPTRAYKELLRIAAETCGFPPDYREKLSRIETCDGD